MTTKTCTNGHTMEGIGFDTCPECEAQLTTHTDMIEEIANDILGHFYEKRWIDIEHLDDAKTPLCIALTTYGAEREAKGREEGRKQASENVKKLGLSRRMKVAETQFALKQLRKQQPELTMHDIAIHNAEAEGYNDGYEKAMSKVIDHLTTTCEDNK